MPQHFLLSSKARSLSLAEIFRLSDDEAYRVFSDLRWEGSGGEPYCPRCGCLKVYEITTRRALKCAACEKQFTVTSGTIFASRKMSYRDLLAAIAIFVNGAKGMSALQLSRDLGVQYKTAFVLSHKLREAMAQEFGAVALSGEVEVDGAFFGGHVKPKNVKADRRDRRLLENRSGKRKRVVVLRERHGRTLSFAVAAEAEGVALAQQRVFPDAVIHADEASHWDALHARFQTRRINHSVRYSDGIACTNMAESYFSRLRRAEIGTHHHIAGPYLNAYAAEMSWREDNRRVSNGDQFIKVVTATMDAAVSRQWKGYWQRRAYRP